MSLTTKLSCWKEQNFITQDQCDQILAFERQRSGRTFWRGAFIVAGSLIGLGICLLIAANWKALGNTFKITGDFLLLGGLFYTTFWCITHQKKGLTEFFAILSFLMIGGTIGLIGQIFNLEGGWHSFALFWALLAIPFVLVSRALFFNLGWLCLLLSSLNFPWVEKLLSQLFHHLSVNTLGVVIVLYLLSYAGKKFDETSHNYTLIPLAFEKLAMWLTYFCIAFIGLKWGTLNHITTETFPANLIVFAFFALRLFLAVRTQNLISFRRNTILLEIYLFVLFASAFGNLFMSGIGFIVGGLSILGLIYLFRHTSRYIKNMEAFK